MLDEIAIQQTINTYSEGVSRRDWNRVMTTFTPSASWEVPSLGAVYRGHDAIRGAMAAFTGEMAYFVQMNAPALISINGELASARCTIREVGKFADRDEAIEFLGVYEDDLMHTMQGWKFTRRVFQVLGQHRYSLLKT